MSNLAGSRQPLIRATAEGRKTIVLLAELGCDLLRAQQNYNSRLAESRDSSDELLILARFHYLRLEQLRRTEQRLLPAAQLIREFAGKARGDRDLVSLKLKYQDSGTKTKTVPPAFDSALSGSLHQGDTLSQVLRVAFVGVREFAIVPDATSKGKVPAWIAEWEDSGYCLDFYPPSFDCWAAVKLDRP